MSERKGVKEVVDQIGMGMRTRMVPPTSVKFDLSGPAPSGLVEALQKVERGLVVVVGTIEKIQNQQKVLNEQMTKVITELKKDGSSGTDSQRSAI